ncbi:MAG: hypothetical protein K2Y37_07355 [Pirellulales bacterium]|nr:hypothetical protein [Pirellulales bacterium]
MSDEQQLLDRLVDGELSPEARRELLQRLEQESGGWRRCALAFLESQSWGEDFSAWLNDPVMGSGRAGGGLESTVTVATTTPTRTAQQGTVLRRSASRRWLDRAGTLLAVAATFMIAFGLGVASRRIPTHGPEGLAAHGGSAPTTDLVTDQAIVATAPVADKASDFSPPGQLAPTELASALDAALASAADDDTGEASPIWLPSGLPGDESLSGGQPSPALPAYVKRALERSGHAIEQQHELWPVQLENGSRALVPVERVKVRYVGNDFK